MPKGKFAVVLAVAAAGRKAVTKCYTHYMEADIGRHGSGTLCAFGGAPRRSRMEL